MLHSIMLPICLRSSGGPGTEAAGKARQLITAELFLPPEGSQLRAAGQRLWGGERSWGRERLCIHQPPGGATLSVLAGARDCPGGRARDGGKREEQLRLLTSASPKFFI